MTDLSPAAQAVLLDGWAEGEGGVYLEGDPERLAAAIRELVSRTKKRKVLTTLGVPMAYSKEYCLAEDLLAIADELGGLEND